MKVLFFILSLFSCIQSIGQANQRALKRSHRELTRIMDSLNPVVKEPRKKEYKFEYTIDPSNLDTNRVTSEVLDNSQKSLKIRVTNNWDEPLDSAKVFLKGADSTYKSYSDKNGEVEIFIPIGNYEIIISKRIYRLYPYHFNFDGKKRLVVALGDGMPTPYSVFSKKRLPRGELMQIQYCLFKNRYKDIGCSQIGRFNVIPQL
jgi:hypothetical protein